MDCLRLRYEQIHSRQVSAVLSMGSTRIRLDTVSVPSNMTLEGPPNLLVSGSRFVGWSVYVSCVCLMTRHVQVESFKSCAVEAWQTVCVGWTVC